MRRDETPGCTEGSGTHGFDDDSGTGCLRCSPLCASPIGTWPCINDPFISFWCRFILPYQSLLEAGLADTVWREFIQPALNTHLDGIFEEVCAQYILHRWHDRHIGTPLRVGRWWGAHTEIDLLAVLRVEEHQVYLLGECKWWQTPVGLNVLQDLQAKVPDLPASYRETLRYALFSVSGFTEELRASAAQHDVTLVDAEILLVPMGRKTV